MISFLADLALRASVLLALAWCAAWACARARASVRHAIWAASFASLLALPLSMATLPPWLLHVGQTPAAGAPAYESVAASAPLRAVSAPPLSLPSGPMRTGVPWELIACGLWLAGAGVLLGGLAREAWAAQRRVVRARGEEVIATGAVRVPQVMGMLRSVILVPPDFGQEPAARRQAILQHERAHIARRDCLWLFVAHAGCALYWWHPLIWSGARALRAAGEQAADDRVLVEGSIPAAEYAGHLVASARGLRARAALGGAMAATSDLEQRVRAILDPARKRVPLNRAGAAAVTALLAGGMMALAAMQVVPLSGPVQTDHLPAFEAASLKPTGPMIGEHNSEHDDPVHMAMRGTLHRMILYAYGISDHEISGEPSWFRGEGWAIDAVSGAPSTEAQKMLMLRRLLADRFHLKLESQTKLVPMYALEVARGGMKAPALAPNAPQPKDPPEPPDTFARCYDSVSTLLNVLNGVYGGRLRLDRQVVDRTGLAGRYALCFSTPMVRAAGEGGRGLSFPNLAADLNAQLGLRLVPVRAPETLYIVTHAAKPVAN